MLRTIKDAKKNKENGNSQENNSHPDVDENAGLNQDVNSKTLTKTTDTAGSDNNINNII